MQWKRTSTQQTAPGERTGEALFPGCGGREGDLCVSARAGHPPSPRGLNATRPRMCGCSCVRACVRTFHRWGKKGTWKSAVCSRGTRNMSGTAEETAELSPPPPSPSSTGIVSLVVALIVDGGAKLRKKREIDRWWGWRVVRSLPLERPLAIGGCAGV